MGLYEDTNPGLPLPGEKPGDKDQYGRELLDDKVIPDMGTAPKFGRWRGGLIHPDLPRFMAYRPHDGRKACQGGWVRSGVWWGRCPECYPD